MEMWPLVQISGMGAVTPYGVGVDLFWQALLEGRSAIAPLTLFEAEGYLYRQAGQVSGADLKIMEQNWTPTTERATLFALTAAQEALTMADLDAAAIEETAVIMATNFGGLATGEALLCQTLGEEPPAGGYAVEALLEADLSHAMRLIGEKLGCGGPAAVLSLSCSSGTAAIARAADWIVAGRAARVLVIGYDSISRVAWSGLCALRTMSSDAVRPFDSRRSGTIFSEGAAALLLESVAAAQQRGGGKQVNLAGWATGNNGTHMTAPAPQGAGSADVMRRALKKSGLAAGAIGHFNAHGTATKLNDSTEAAALHSVLGDHAAAIPTTSNKGAVGHLMGAAGTAEAISSILTLRTGLVPPTANHAEPDPECPLDIVVGKARQTDAGAVISNSAGIGGTNAAIILTL